MTTQTTPSAAAIRAAKAHFGLTGYEEPRKPDYKPDTVWQSVHKLAAIIDAETRLPELLAVIQGLIATGAFDDRRLSKEEIAALDAAEAAIARAA